MCPHVLRRLSQTFLLHSTVACWPHFISFFTPTTKHMFLPSLTVLFPSSSSSSSSLSLNNFIVIIITVIIILVITTTTTTPNSFLITTVSHSFFSFSASSSFNKQLPPSFTTTAPVFQQHPTSSSVSSPSFSFLVPLHRRHTLSVVDTVTPPRSIPHSFDHQYRNQYQIHLKSIMSSPAVAQQQQQHHHHHHHHRRRRPSRPRPVSQPASASAAPQPQQSTQSQPVAHRHSHRHQRPRPQRPVSTGSQTAGGGGGRGGTTTTTAVAPASASSVTPATPIPVQKPTSSSYPMESAPTKKQVGNAGWTLIHSIAANYPEHPSEVDRYHANAFLTSIAKLYPCKRCRRHFEKYIVASPPELNSKQAFMLWACKAHNDVNRRNNKKEFPCTLQMLEQRWGDCGCTLKAA